MEKLKYFFIKKIYADHNSSKSVKETLDWLIQQMPANGNGLNIGAGHTKLDNRIKNMEIEAGENIDYVGRIENIPLPEKSMDLIISQEVLEHVENPWEAMHEISRVLKDNGKIYLQLPFIIGFHPCPRDYWRFTNEGIVQLANATGFKVIKSGQTVGSATGFYRISVEFFAILFSLLSAKLYKPFKAIFSLLLYPIKWLDPLLSISPENHRIPGGYYVVCEKQK